MGITKHGTGEIIPDPERPQQHTAHKMTQADLDALAEENRKADGDLDRDDK